MYLELPDIQSFIDEIKDKKIKETRVIQTYQQIPANPVSFTSVSVIFTATDGKDIIKYTEIIGRELSIWKEKIDELVKRGEEFIALQTKALKGYKIEVKKGMFKYPAEMVV